MRSQLNLGTLTIYPPRTHCYDNYNEHFTDFSSNQVTQPTDPPAYHTVAM